MKALLVGATGATGKDVLNLLLDDPSFQQVDIFVRKPIPLSHDKLNIHIINFDNIKEWQHLVKGDVLFSCLGTTLKAAGSKKEQWKVDFDYQYAFAKAARQHGVHTMVLVSSSMASPDSVFFYNKMKGRLEQEVKALNFSFLRIFKPPLLIRENSDRKAEVWSSKIIRYLNSLGLLKSQTPLPTSILAQALVQASKDKQTLSITYDSKEIWAYAEKQHLL